MKFVINRDVFKDAVSFTAKLLPARTTLPILMGVKITASGDRVEFSAFDYEVSSRTSVQADVQAEGSVLILGPMLANIAGSLKTDTVVVEEVDNAVVVRAGSWETKLQRMPIEEYPTTPDVTGRTGLVRGGAFAEAIAQVSIAASKEDVTPVITGVQLEANEHELTLIATDRYRVSVKSVEWDGGEAGDNLQALVPARTLAEVGRMFGGAETVEITMSDSQERQQIAFTAGDKTVTTLLIKGNYPPVRRLFPAETPHYAVVNTAELIEATKRVQLVLDREAALRCTFADNTLTLEGSGSDQAASRDTIDIVLNGEDSVLSLKPQFLLDGLGAAHSEFVRIAFTKSENTNKPGPLLITRQTSREEPASDEFKYLLQPNLLIR